MPQGDAPSPYLFNIFMDDYLGTINSEQSRGLATLFVDDMLLVAKTIVDMQRLLQTSESWATKVQMEWGASKSCGIKLHGLVKILGQTLQDRDEDFYLGVSFNHRGVTGSKLVDRLNGSLRLLATLRTVTARWTLTVRQSKKFVKTFIFSKCDYLLFLQPMTDEVKSLAGELDRKSNEYILGVNVTPQNRERPLAITRILPLQARRRRHLLKLIWKFHSRAISSKETTRDTENWKVLRSYDTIRPVTQKTRPPDTQDELNAWVKEQLNKVHTDTWKSANKLTRKIPAGHSIPPAFRSMFSTLAERKAAHWYLNKIPRSQTLSQTKPQLGQLMAKHTLSDSESRECEILLLRLASAT